MSERVSVSEAAKILGVSRQAIHNRIKSGKYPAQKVIDGVQEYYEIPRGVVENELSIRDVKPSSIRKGLGVEPVSAPGELMSRLVSQLEATTVGALQAELIKKDEQLQRRDEEIARKDLALQRLQEGLIQLAEKSAERRSWFRRFFRL